MCSDDHRELHHLPRIDFSGLDQSCVGSEEWAAARALVASAAETYGCFEVVYDRVTPDLQDAIFGKCVTELFALPLDKKVENVSDKLYHGYNGFPSSPYESLNIENAAARKGVDEFTDMMWGVEGNPTFCDAVLAFSKHLLELEHMARRMVLESLGAEELFESLTESTKFNLRLAKYSGGSQIQAGGLGRHTDSAIVSIVCQHGVEGLEVETKDGRWLTPSPNSITVMFGDAFCAWSNGRIEAPWHRVVMTGGSEMRYSAIFGAVPRDGCAVRAPARLVDSDRPLQFRPFEYGDYVTFRYSETGLRSEYPLRTFCGVLQGQ